MTRPFLSLLRRRQSGMSLIELMISMTIGMVIALAATSAYLGASTAGTVAEAQGRMNEDGQMALNILTQQLRMAGSNPLQANRTLTYVTNPLATQTYAVRGCDLAFSNASTATNTFALTCGHASGSAGPDSIAIGYEADAYNTSSTAVGGTPTDCMGGAISPVLTSVQTATNTTVNVNVYQALNTYYIGTSSAIVSPSLYCKGKSSTATPLVENIETMQITYGVNTPTVTSTVAGYLSAFAVENDSNLNSAVDPDGGTTGGPRARWESVKVVRVCVIARTTNPILNSTVSASYYDCTGTLITAPPDLRMRRAFTTTVVLRNQELQ